MRIKSNSHSPSLNRSSSTRIENIKSERPIIVIVAETSKVGVSAGSDDLGAVFDGDGYVAVAVFVFVVGVEGDGGADESCGLAGKELGAVSLGGKEGSANLHRCESPSLWSWPQWGVLQ